MITLKPFQELGRDWLTLRKNAILADDMGLGKTYQVLEAIKKLRLQSGIIICPQSIRRTWALRVREQIPNAFINEIRTSKYIPDPGAINVVNYDIAWKEPLITLFKEQQWQFLVCDESHYLKNIEAKRTKAILGKKGLYGQCEYRWFVTGTPVLNRPIELYPALRSLFPLYLGKYKNFYDYAYKFCAGYQGTFGFDCTGASNLELLSRILQPIMLRRMKKEVQKELPEVTYEKIYLDPSDKLIRLTEDERKNFNAKKLLGEISSLRRALGVIKCQAAVHHIKDLLEEKDKLVIFVWHKDVAQTIAQAFPKEYVLYTGSESPAQKDTAIRKFRDDKGLKLFIGNLKSAGIGVDGLQYVCDTCIFVEMSYVPGEIRQAVDRLSRMGQENPVLAQFLIAENSVDEDVINSLTEKSRNINTIMQERRDVAFVETRCGFCKKVTELKKLKRVLKLSVCSDCEKNLRCIL